MNYNKTHIEKIAIDFSILFSIAEINISESATLELFAIMLCELKETQFPYSPGFTKSESTSFLFSWLYTRQTFLPLAIPSNCINNELNEIDINKTNKLRSEIFILLDEFRVVVDENLDIAQTDTASSTKFKK